MSSIPGYKNLMRLFLGLAAVMLACAIFGNWLRGSRFRKPGDDLLFYIAVVAFPVPIIAAGLLSRDARRIKNGLPGWFVTSDRAQPDSPQDDGAADSA